jgi:RNA polymerase sigma-70 factor (ECF subfamily)
MQRHALLGSLYWQALRMTHQHADAEDLLQDTTLTAYAHVHAFEQATNLQAWMYRILTTNYINAYRRIRAAMQALPAQVPDREADSPRDDFDARSTRDCSLQH